MSGNRKYHFNYTFNRTDPTIDRPTELLLEIGNPPADEGTVNLVAGIDRSIINGLRRIIYTEVKTKGFAKPVLIPESYLDTKDNIQHGNVTIFNGEHLADRIGMVPIHDFVPLTMNETAVRQSGWTPPPSLIANDGDWVFRICDSQDPNLPLKHLDDGDLYNRQRYVKVSDIRVFRRKNTATTVLDAIAAATNTDPNADTASVSNAGTEMSSQGSESTPITAVTSGTGPILTTVGETGKAEGAGALPTHSKEKVAQVTSKIDYIILDGNQYTEMDDNFKRQIFKYPDLILLSLKKGEGVFAEMTSFTGWGSVLNPNAMLPEVYKRMSHARWISAIPDYRFKKEKEFSPDYDEKTQIANSLKNFELDGRLAPLKSALKLDENVLEKVIKYRDNIDTSKFFEPGSAELEAEKDLIQRKIVALEKHIAELKDRIQEEEARRIPNDLALNPIDDQKNYRRSQDPILGRYDNPERYLLHITYNGHLWPEDIWVLAIQTLIDKVEGFKYILNNIQDVSGRVTERASVLFSPNITNLMQIHIDDKVNIESHTLGNLIKCHFLYLLDHLIESRYPNKYTEVLSHCFSTYKIEHPLKADLFMTFKTPGESFPLFPKSAGIAGQIEESETTSSSGQGQGQGQGSAQGQGQGSAQGQGQGDSDEMTDPDLDRDDKVSTRATTAASSQAKGDTVGSVGTTNIARKGPFDNLYDRETNETLRLLKITCDMLLIRLNELSTEAMAISMSVRTTN